MPIALFDEISGLRGFARRNGKPLLVVSLATLSFILFRYHTFGSLVLRYAILYLAIPAVGLLLIRRNPLDTGLRAGDYRRWRVHVLAACAVSLAIVVVGKRFESVGTYYESRSVTPLARYIAERIVIIFAIEYLYRGFLLFGLREELGEGAILVQMIPFALLHAGKPEIETIGCILTGLYFGYVAYRTNSIWPVFIIHLFANVANRIIHAL
jgi:membrane protease YdiL (CAAX protease family)